MKQNPFFSLIVPVYKVEKYLDECISSILEQNYENYELILVDDGSPDRCPIMCDDWAEKDNRITVIHKENGGLSDARNCGLAVAKGQYVWFIDSDDWISENALDKLYKHLGSTNFSIDVINFLMLVCKENGETTFFNKIKENVSSILTNKKYVENGNPLFPVMQFVIKREVLSKNNLLFIKGVLHEDIPFGHMLICSVSKVYLCSEILYNYRKRESSITTSSSISSCYSLVKSYKLMIDYATKHLNPHKEKWYMALFYDYFHEIFLRIYPFWGTDECDIFMNKNEDFLITEFNNLSKFLNFKRRMLLCVFRLSPHLYSYLVFSKQQ